MILIPTVQMLVEEEHLKVVAQVMGNIAVAKLECQGIILSMSMQLVTLIKVVSNIITLHMLMPTMDHRQFVFNPVHHLMN